MIRRGGHALATRVEQIQTGVENLVRAGVEKVTPVGGMQEEFAAYGRGGEPCPRCGAAIAVIRCAGRSSHFCPACQPEP